MSPNQTLSCTTRVSFTVTHTPHNYTHIHNASRHLKPTSVTLTDTHRTQSLSRNSVTMRHSHNQTSETLSGIDTQSRVEQEDISAHAVLQQLPYHHHSDSAAMVANSVVVTSLPHHKDLKRYRAALMAVERAELEEGTAEFSQLLKQRLQSAYYDGPPPVEVDDIQFTATELGSVVTQVAGRRKKLTNHASTQTDVDDEAAWQSLREEAFKTAASVSTTSRSALQHR